MPLVLLENAPNTRKSLQLCLNEQHKRQRQEIGVGECSQRLRQRVRGGFEKLTARAQRIAFFSVGAAVRGEWQLRCHPPFASAQCHVGQVCGGMTSGLSTLAA